MNVVLTSKAKLPKRRKVKPIIPPQIVKAMKLYAQLYRAVYKRDPLLVYDAPYVRIDTQPGVKLQRLKELSKMLKDSIRDIN